MKTAQRILVMIALFALLAACNLPTRPTSAPGIDQALAGTIVAMTLEAMHTRTPTGAAPVMDTALPSATPGPRLTATQTVTITPTFSTPLLSFDGNTNCREGPGTDFKVVVVLRSGQKVEPAGVQDKFWIVKNPDGKGLCWVSAEFATPSGSVWTLPTMTAPALPTREPPIAPVWSNWNFTCAFASGGSTVTMNLVWTDRANGETGFKVYREGQVIATLAADTSSYTDSAFVASGKSLSYYVEVYSDAGKASSSAISASCQ